MTEIPELLALKIENVALNMRLMQVEQEKLVQQARVACGAPEDAVYNISTRQFQANGT